tara:strand:+ start:15449 stop:16480 length:1032 start_codon:yes stop_codon:yes gene_type:complete
VNAFKKKFAENEILSSYNIARNCDKVFVEAVTHEQYEILKSKESFIVSKNESLIVYKNTKLTLEENDVIFCHSSFINELFYLLKKVKTLRNIKLVTSQSDVSITKKLFSKKPKCISEWYSININYKHPNLIPIPLGIANDYSPKNLRYLDFSNFLQESREVVNLIYCNFNPNTNNKERLGIYKLFEGNPLFKFENATLSINDYITRLSEFKFVLAPCGNGFDTHRLWEAFYLGAIPIIRKHETYSYLDERNVLIVEEYSKINQDHLEKFLEDYQPIDEKLLKVRWWIDSINKNKIKHGNIAIIQETKILTIYRYYEQLFLFKSASYFKKVKYYIKKIINKLIN